MLECGASPRCGFFERVLTTLTSRVGRRRESAARGAERRALRFIRDERLRGAVFFGPRGEVREAGRLPGQSLRVAPGHRPRSLVLLDRPLLEPSAIALEHFCSFTADEPVARRDGHVAFGLQPMPKRDAALWRGLCCFDGGTSPYRFVETPIGKSPSWWVDESLCDPSRVLIWGRSDPDVFRAHPDAVSVTSDDAHQIAGRSFELLIVNAASPRSVAEIMQSARARGIQFERVRSGLEDEAPPALPSPPMRFLREIEEALTGRVAPTDRVALSGSERSFLALRCASFHLQSTGYALVGYLACWPGAVPGTFFGNRIVLRPCDLDRFRIRWVLDVEDHRLSLSEVEPGCST